MYVCVIVYKFKRAFFPSDEIPLPLFVLGGVSDERAAFIPLGFLGRSGLAEMTGGGHK